MLMVSLHFHENVSYEYQQIEHEPILWTKMSMFIGHVKLMMETVLNVLVRLNLDDQAMFQKMMSLNV
jgi:hypothetical protein